MGPLSVDMYLPSFPEIEIDLNTSTSLVGATLSSFFIGLCCGQLIYGPLSDRVGRKGPLLVGLAIYLFASLGCFLAPSIESLLVMRFFQALGSCSGMVVGRAMIRDLFDPHETAKVFSLVMLGMGIAPILAPLGGQLIAEHLGWRAIFLFMVLFAGTVWIGVARTIPDIRAPESTGRVRLGRTLLDLLKHREFMGFALSGTMIQAGLFAYITGSPTLFISGYGFSPRGYSLLFGLNAIGLIGASQLNNILLNRYSFETILRWVLGIAATMSVVIAAMGLSGWGGVMVTIPLFVFMSSLGLVFPNSTAGALADQQSRAGTASALLGIFQYGGAAVASGVVGILQLYTPAAMELTIGICGVLSITIFHICMKKRAD